MPRPSEPAPRTVIHPDRPTDRRKPVNTPTAARRRPWAVALALGAMLAPALGFAGDAPVPDKGDTAWMMTSTVLVILMTIPGLALFYGGMARSKNVLSLLMQVFMIFCMVSLLWAIYGYSLAFTTGNAVHRRVRPALHAGARDRLAGGDLQQGRGHPRVRLLHLPAHVRVHHARADRRRVRRAHQVQRRAAVHGAVVHVLLPADRAHGVVLGRSRMRTRTPEAGAAAATPPQASCSRRARSTSRAAPSCTSTPASRVSWAR